MTQHDPWIALRQLRDHVNEAVELAGSTSREKLENDRVVALALVQLLLVAGEAASRVDGEQRQKWAEIPWRQMVAMRNRLIHGYDTIDLDIVWHVVTVELPRVQTTLKTIDRD